MSLLKHYRQQNGVTQEALAFRTGVTIATLSRIERGVTEPTWRSIRAIAKALDLSLGEFGAAVELEDKRLNAGDDAQETLPL